MSTWNTRSRWGDGICVHDRGSDIFKSIIAAVSLAVVAAPASANLVVNGGFETGDFTGWEQVNDTSFSGVAEGDFGGFAPPEGEFQAFFGPVEPTGGGILQDITTVAGASYTLSFQMANLGNPPNAFGLFWNGGFVDITFDQDSFPYTVMNATLVATTTSTDLGFIFYHEPSFFLLDDIVLNAAVPEPASWAMMIAGFALAGAAARRRKAMVSYA